MKADGRLGVRDVFILSLNDMKRGESGVIKEILGGHGFARRLESMNIRVGKNITKVSAMFRRGPVTVQADHTRLALGFGMAGRIIVEVKR
ncbi:MAG: ferrous iron transport protein A [Spirochaetales bacterium]|nr:ferrous iron transport protein A [Spirochaetales bacterium]